MPGEYLTTNSRIQCPHGGQAILVTPNTRVTIDMAPVLLESDIHMIAGCPFTIGPKYSPCIRIEWKLGTKRSNIQGTPALNKNSIGQCINAEGAIQGIAFIVNSQMKVAGQ